MFQNTKLLVVFTLIVLFSGVGFVWFGLKQNETAVVQKQPVDSSYLGIEGEKRIVVKVIDGDTIELDNDKSVRLVGIDTPETVDPRRPVGCFGKEASNESRNLLMGKMVILQKDISDTDKYGRLLRLIYLPLPDGQLLFVNDYLVRQGFAKSYTYPPDVKYDDQFKKAQDQARENKRGLWHSCK